MDRVCSRLFRADCIVTSTQQQITPLPPLSRAGVDRRAEALGHMHMWGNVTAVAEEDAREEAARQDARDAAGGIVGDGGTSPAATETSTWGVGGSAAGTSAAVGAANGSGGGGRGSVWGVFGAGGSSWANLGGLAGEGGAAGR